jgi:hypothetical protein
MVSHTLMHSSSDMKLFGLLLASMVAAASGQTRFTHMVERIYNDNYCGEQQISWTHELNRCFEAEGEDTMYMITCGRRGTEVVYRTYDYDDVTCTEPTLGGIVTAAEVCITNPDQTSFKLECSRGKEMNSTASAPVWTQKRHKAQKGN